MRIRDFLVRPAGPPLVVGLALILSTLGPEARAQQSDAVQAVRRALFNPLPTTEVPEELTKALQERAKTLQQLTDDKSQLQALGDMAQALLLPNWSEGTADTTKVDRDAYKALLARFIGALRAEIKAAEQAKTPDVRAAAVTMVGEFAATARSGVSGQRGNKLLIADIPQFTELVAGVATSDRSPEVRVAAASALAKLQSDPVKDSAPKPVTVPALETLLKDKDVSVRRAAALALGDLLRGTRSADRAYAASPVVEASRENLAEFGPQVARAAGAVLKGGETDSDVRRLALEALAQVGSSLKNWLRRVVIGTPEHQQLRPAVDALWEQTGAISAASRDADPRVQHTALRALEEMGDVRLYWVAPPTPETIRTAPTPERPRGGSTKPPKLGFVPADESSQLTLTYAEAQAPAKPKGEPAPLADAIPALVASLKDDNVRNRLAAIDALETITVRIDEQKTLAQELGAKPTAAAARALTRALDDPDRFVRWAAARTLGEMAPLDDADEGGRVERGAVGGLARLLSDRDPDVRMRSAIALELFGNAARSAVPALAGAVTNRGDLEARISAAHAIEVIGGHAAEAVPALADDLTDPNVRMRRIAAEALSSYGADAVAAKPALNRALFDSDPEVRRLVSEALLKIGTRK